MSAAVTAHSYTLTLTSHDDNYPGDPSYSRFDDISLSKRVQRRRAAHGPPPLRRVRWLSRQVPRFGALSRPVAGFGVAQTIEPTAASACARTCRVPLRASALATDIPQTLRPPLATVTWRSEESLVEPPSKSDVGALLDAHHTPETNGRMAICRRCGAMTDSPGGSRHTPGDLRLDRLCEWLDAQERMRLFQDARDALLS